MSKQEILKLENINKSYKSAGSELEILRDVNLTINAQESVALLGPSGCGKSTLLHIAGLLDKADDGNITINGEDASGASDKIRTKLRRNNIGFVYQHHHLLAEFSAFENVMMPLKIDHKKKSASCKKASDLLEQIGLADRMKHRPSMLSGGQQQRVSIARALIHQPSLILADEPTGNLDPDNAEKIFKLLLEQCKANNAALLLVTHNQQLAKRADRIIKIENGGIV